MKNNVDYKVITSFILILCMLLMPIASAIYNVINYKEVYKSFDVEWNNKNSIIYMIRGAVSGAYKLSYAQNVMIDLNGEFQKIIGKKLINDVDSSKQIIKLNNDYLTFPTDKLDVSDFASNTIEFRDYLLNRGTEFLYVSVPGKISKYDNQLPLGIDDYSNQNADKFIELLSENDVDYIDVREEFHKANINQYDYFFKTDHHWTPQGGFLACDMVCSRLSKNYGMNIDNNIFDFNNYNQTEYKNWILGSQGKRVGIFYAGTDDFTVMTPKFETDVSMKVKNKNIYKRGTFDQVLLDMNQIGNRYYYLDHPYTTYMINDFPETEIINYNSVNNKKILLIKDSFACVFSPFFALSCNQLNIIDLRYYDEDLRAYIEKIDPDIVIVMYSCTEFGYSTYTFN